MPTVTLGVHPLPVDVAIPRAGSGSHSREVETVAVLNERDRSQYDNRRRLVLLHGEDLHRHRPVPKRSQKIAHSRPVLASQFSSPRQGGICSGASATCLVGGGVSTYRPRHIFVLLSCCEECIPALGWSNPRRITRGWQRAALTCRAFPLVYPPESLSDAVRIWHLLAQGPGFMTRLFSLWLTHGHAHGHHAHTVIR